jgi:hypothetical protein
MDGTDLTALGPSEASSEVQTARSTLSSRYGVPINWFAYPRGSYDAGVIAAVRGAGFVGAQTSNAGWATQQGDRYRLPRLEVLSGTSPSTLLADIASAQNTTSAPASSSPTSSG